MRKQVIRLRPKTGAARTCTFFFCFAPHLLRFKEREGFASGDERVWLCGLVDRCVFWYIHQEAEWDSNGMCDEMLCLPRKSVRRSVATCARGCEKVTSVVRRNVIISSGKCAENDHPWIDMGGPSILHCNKSKSLLNLQDKVVRVAHMSAWCCALP
jgi:hypothetical protein